MTVDLSASLPPVDMSVTVPLYVTELGLLVQMLGTDTACSALRTRLLAAASQCDAQGAVLTQMKLSALEQGFVMGCLANVSCRFACTLRARMGTAMVQSLVALGAPDKP